MDSQLADRLCEKVKGALSETPVDGSLVEGIAKDFCLMIVDNEENLSAIGISELKERFSKASKIGKRALDSQIKQIKHDRERNERLDFLEGQSEEFKECVSHIESLLTCAPKHARVREGEIYQEIFDQAFELDEIEFLLNEISATTGVKISTIKRKWTLLLAGFLEKDKKQLVDKATSEAGVDIKPFVVKNHQFHKPKTTETGTEFVKLCNFNAHISEDIRYIDGQSEKRCYRLKGEVVIAGKVQILEPIEIDSADFKKMNWLHEWGAGTNIDSTAATDANVRDCIEKLSLTKTKKHKAFTHTGWREIDDEYYFLQKSGAIGTKGISDSIEVRLDGSSKGEGKIVLSHYDLTVNRYGKPLKVDDKEVIKNAVSSSLDILELSANKPACYLLLLSAYRAVLNEALGAEFSTFFYGYTGSFKTEFTALAQAHFGAGFHGKHLPANWTGTGMSLEYLLFITKDVLTACDDFNPTGSPQQIAEFHKKAEIVFRGQGNQAGRTRLTADIELRPEYHPRGLVMGSGEDLPQGESLRSRILFAELKKGDIASEDLSKAQDLARDGSYCIAMYNFVKFIAGLSKDNELTIKLEKDFRTQREKLKGLVTNASHLRLVDQIASLSIALDVLLNFAINHDAISDARANAIAEEGRTALRNFIPSQNELQLDQNPAFIFCSIIGTVLTTGKANLQCKDDELTLYTDIERYGYIKTESDFSSGQYKTIRMRNYRLAT